jgi:DNA primase
MKMKYPKEYLDEIKLRVKVSQIAGKYVQLKKRGKEFIGLSPFKNEKTPSFTINDEKGFYHCFSTGEHGNVFDFLMKTRSLGFGEAVKVLASEAGMQPYKFSKFDKEKEEKYSKYKKIIKEYSDYFQNQLFDKKNSFALDYLKKRKLSEEAIKKFQLGYVPINNFFNELSKKYSIDDIKSTGLYYFIEKNKKYIDRFKNRIIFPIFNLSGDVVAFGGRIINGENLAKYINSPETEFFKKGRQLFNLNLAKDERSNTKEVIIVEGYMDVISLYSRGIKNVISNCGTAITESQINLIWKFFSNPIICLDGDKSGQQAALRIAERLIPFINEENRIYFSILHQGKDPDDIIKELGKEGFLKFLERKNIIQSFIWDSYVNKINVNNPYEVTRFEKQMRKLCFLIKDDTLKKYILEDFLTKINNLTPNVNKRVNYNYSKQKNFKVLNETKKIHLQKKDLTRENLVEFSILFIMIFYGKAIKNSLESISQITFSNSENEKLKTLLINQINSNRAEKEIENEAIKINPNLVENIVENSNLKLIVNKKNYEQIKELFEDFMNDLIEGQNKKKIESLERKLINNMEENAYSELLKLKNQINRD